MKPAPFFDLDRPRATRFASSLRLAGAALACISSFAVGVACSNPSPSIAPVAEADFASTMADRVCAAAATCCDAIGGKFDAGACRSSVGGDASQMPSLYPGTRYDAQAAGACIAAAAAQYASCPSSLEELPWNSHNPCDDVWVGTAKLGEACATVACAPTSPQGPLGCVNGVCATGVYGGAGQPCDTTIGNHFAECDPAVAYCPVIEGARTCVAYLAKGAPCDTKIMPTTDAACGPGNYCAPQPDGTFGCAPAPHLGEPCLTECEGSFCDETSHTCVAALDVGAPCSTSSNVDCKPGLLCINGSCTVTFFPPGCVAR